VKAMAAYIAAIIGPPTAKRDGAHSSPTPSASRALVAAHGGADGAAIYAGACAGCHEATGQSFSARGIPLGDSKVISMPDARNLAHVILEGIEAPHASPAATMPGFADGLTDRQVAELMIYLRKTFSDKQAWEGLENTVRKVRAASPAS
jgi:mono/diheme cytochrome c family protein